MSSHLATSDQNLSPEGDATQAVVGLTASAFEAVYAKYHQLIFTIAMRFLKDKELAKDAVQDVFVKLWGIRKDVDTDKNIQGFLVVLTKNYLLNCCRKNKYIISKSASGNPTTLARNELDTEYVVGWQLLLDQFEKIILRMPPRKRLIFSMKILNGLSNEEVASELGLSINTIKVQYSDAKSLMERHITAKGGGGLV